MKKILAFVLTALIAVSSYGKQLTLQEAIKRTQTYNKGLSIDQPELVMTLKEGENNLIYVINNGNSFNILSADDCAPALLGKSERGTIDADNMPDALKWWIGQYEQQISYAIKTGTTLKSLKATGASIEPLLTSTWNQHAPFNNQCVEVIDGSKSVSGCVATAMAQVMYYHQWPARGTGSHSYSYDINVNGQTKTITPSANFETTYEWDKMLPSYKGSYSEEEGNAVATLVQHCGVSVNMEYKGNVASAYTIEMARALINYFDYDKGIKQLYREMLTDEEWAATVYNELANRRPVVYSGDTETSGHAFICDGYRSSDGYFHFNWGWGGLSDGYFSIIGEDALNPNEQGAGGSDGKKGYIYNQEILVGIMPNQENPYEIYMESKEDYTLNYSRADRDTRIKFQGKLANASIITAKFDIALRFINIDDENEVYHALLVSNANLKNRSYYDEINFYPSSVCKNGTYDVVPVYREVGTTEWKEMNRKPGTVIPTIEIIGEEPECYLTKGIEMPYVDVTVADDVSIKFTLKALTTFSNSRIVAYVFPEGGGSNASSMSITISMEEGEEREIELSKNMSSSLAVGSRYYFKLYDVNTDMYLAPDELAKHYFTVVEANDLPTGISVPTAQENTGRTDVYTLSGQKVRSNVEKDKMLQGLPRGIYIADGKKIIIR